MAVVATALAMPLIVRTARKWNEARIDRRARTLSRARRREVRDPGRERRAEQRARELLRSCVNAEEWAMYRDLGFIRVHGRMARKSARTAQPAREDASAQPRYAYLIYPHKPIVAFVPKTGRLL